MENYQRNDHFDAFALVLVMGDILILWKQLCLVTSHCMPSCKYGYML